MAGLYKHFGLKYVKMIVIIIIMSWLVSLIVLVRLKLLLTKSFLMESKLNQALVSGMIATTIMTLIMYIFSLLGLPEVHPPFMLSDMMSISIVLGWILHFFIGIVFALLYIFAFKLVVKKIKSKFYKGALFGITLFVVAQIAVVVMAAIFKSVSVKCDFPEGEAVIAEHVAAILKNGCDVVRQGGTKAIIVTLVLSLISHICYGVALVYSMFKPKEK